MSQLTLIQSDYGYDIQFSVVDNNGSPVVLSGSTVMFKVANYVSLPTLIVDATCSITNSALGLCKYTVSNGDFDVVGSYKAELNINYTSPEKVVTAQNVNIVVVPKLGS